ncbi:23 kDa integral membrane protein-like isoform X2 [Maniola jurtina]|uniref:23 kDa integral membrane protein-like isoform X2 n=1 Tax=Maniola jurtina TaxID=191418 RepID=UPI001E689DB8|nr:23 kDa integral membrane protein-like isoform X2 [Maniola jurtina]
MFGYGTIKRRNTSRIKSIVIVNKPAIPYILPKTAKKPKMCFIVKYVLFIANVIFALAGLTLIGVGSAVLALASDALAVIPAGINAIPISVIVLGAIVFVISFFGCCGAIRENRCFLTTYAIIMLLLAAGKMYLAVVIFMAMDNIYVNVVEWLTKAFLNEDLREPFHAVEIAFRCCGTTGWQSYLGILPALPASCCNPDAEVCQPDNAFGGCNDIVGDFFATYGSATASILVVIIAVELIAMIVGLSLCNNVSNRRRATV